MGKKKPDKKKAGTPELESAEPKPTGRPTSYTPELGDLICALLAEGKSLRKVCALEDMPAISTVLLWVMKGERKDAIYEAFSEQYRVAREAQAEFWVDEIVDISDDDSNDYAFRELADGDGSGARAFVVQDNIQRSKLMVDARKWAASKLRPKKYGDKITQEHTGKDGKDLPAAQTTVIVGALAGKSLDELSKLFTDKIKG